MVAAARKRAKAKGIPFCISARDLVIPAICPVLAIPLAVGDGRPSDASPSLDRIVPALGYVKGNVVVISMRANRLKSDATVDELRALADFFEIATPVTPRRWRTNPT